MAKIFYVTEKTPDFTLAHFFKTEKEALAYGISEWSDFDMFGDPDSEDDSYDKDNDVWFEGDWINTPSGILFSFEEGRAYLQSSDDEEARKYVKKEVGSDGAAIFFDKFKKGMYGYLGNGADGKGFKWEWDGDEINESLVTEKFNFSKKEVEKAATLIASAISQADMVKAKVHDLEYDKGRGAGFEISIDGDKYAGGSYVVKDNGDVVNAAIGNSHPNAVYNTIGNKDIADVFINMEKYESLIDESVDAKDIVKTIKAVSKMHDTKFMNPFLMHEEPTHMHKELGAVKIHPGVPAYDWRRKGVIAVSTSLKGSKDWQFTGVDLKDLSELPKNFKLPKQWLSESVTELTWDSLKESLGLTEAKFNKKSLMKAMKADDGMVQLGNGKEYVIYAYDNGNDDNDDMWGDKTIFGLDQDGEEHEIEYSDIVSYNESTVNEGRSINKISKELEKTVLDMKKTVDEWKIAEGDRKSELLEKLRELNKNKVELSKELDSAVAGKDHDLQLAITEAEELAYLELDVINILND